MCVASDGGRPLLQTLLLVTSGQTHRFNLQFESNMNKYKNLVSGVRMRPAFKSVGRPSKLRQTSSGQEHRGRGGGVQQQQHLICYDSGCRCQEV